MSERIKEAGSEIGGRSAAEEKRQEMEREKRETDEMRAIKRGKTRQGGSGETPIKAQIR